MRRLPDSGRASASRQRPAVTLGSERVVAERVVTQRDSDADQLVTAIEQTTETRLRVNVIRRRTAREVLKREELPPAVETEPAPADIPPSLDFEPDIPPSMDDLPPPAGDIVPDEAPPTSAPVEPVSAEPAPAVAEATETTPEEPHPATVQPEEAPAPQAAGARSGAAAWGAIAGATAGRSGERALRRRGGAAASRVRGDAWSQGPRTHRSPQGHAAAERRPDVAPAG